MAEEKKTENVIWHLNATEGTKKALMDSQLVLWDLDGTLYESGQGIRNGLLYAIRMMGLAQPDLATLNAMIGPPLRDSFQRFFGLSPDQANTAIRHYRVYYVKKGLYEGSPYPGVRETLAALKQEGKILTVATSKPWIFAHRVLGHYQLRSYFDTVLGCYRNGRLDSKNEVIQAVLEHYQGIKPLAKGRLLGDALTRPLGNDFKSVMIGDRFYDVEGAKAHGIDTIGVSYGYGTSEELLNSGAVAVVHQPGQLLDILS
jgi:phosphoglycolate phosphatase